MRNRRLFAFGAAALLALAAVEATPVQASSLYQIDFTATVTDVTFPLVAPVSVGDEFHGNFVYDADAVAGVGSSELTPGNGLISLSFNMQGTTFTEADDVDYPEYPAAYFQDGLFDNELDYLHTGNAGPFEFDLRLSDEFSAVVTGFAGIPDGIPGIPGGGSQGPPLFENFGVFGTLAFSDARAVDAVVVPLPAAAWGGLALLGMLGVGRTVRRRRQAECV